MGTTRRGELCRGLRDRMVASGAGTAAGGELSRGALPSPLLSFGDGLGLGATSVDVA